MQIHDFYQHALISMFIEFLLYSKVDVNEHTKPASYKNHWSLIANFISYYTINNSIIFITILFLILYANFYIKLS